MENYNHIEAKKISIILLIIIVFHIFYLAKEVPHFSFKTSALDENKIKLQIISEVVKSNQIVQTKESLDQIEVEKKFLGKKTTTFARQTVAKNIGTFKDASKGRKEATSVFDSAKSARDKKVNLRDLAFKGNIQKEDHFKKIAKKSESRKGVQRGTSQIPGLSQNNDFIKNIALGDFTQLNTQEYEFYGFYHRIRQKLEQFWGRNIQEQAEKIAKQGRSIASGTNHVTALEIELNSHGEIINVFIKGKSGVKELDTTAIDTFNQAGPFPNPPKKMLINNKVKINWSFVVTT